MLAGCWWWYRDFQPLVFDQVCSWATVEGDQLRNPVEQQPSEAQSVVCWGGSDDKVTDVPVSQHEGQNVREPSSVALPHLTSSRTGQFIKSTLGIYVMSMYCKLVAKSSIL